ncbi:MAG: hypothetical protein JKX81_09070 [Arenicella sp.]|nr:hypothetical protein [Arenicella sp.]
MPYDDGANTIAPTTNGIYDEDTPPLIRRTPEIQTKDKDEAESELVLSSRDSLTRATDSNKSLLVRYMIYTIIVAAAIGACYLIYSKMALENRIVLPASDAQGSIPQASPNPAEVNIDESSLASPVIDESAVFSIASGDNFEEIIAPIEDSSTIEIIDETSDISGDIMESRVQTRQAPINSLSRPLFGDANTSRVIATESTPDPFAQSLYRRAYNLRHRDKSQAITYLQQALEKSNTENLTSKIKSLLKKTSYELDRANGQ